MKFKFVIIFVYLAQMSMLAQQSEWRKEVVKKNNVKMVLGQIYRLE